MTRLLHVISSPRRDDSTSRAIGDTFVGAWREQHPGGEVDVLDLWTDPIPAFDGDRAAAKMTVIGGETPEGRLATAWDSVAEVFSRFARADRYVFGIPMWNAGIPWVLKQYIDTITQPGMAFSFDPATGYTGLLTGRKALAIYTSGVYHRGVEPAFGSDFQSPYVDDWLRFVGITDIAELRFQPTLLTPSPEDDLALVKREALDLASTF
jgi:FMN-dependent NADH-azoreductase